MTIKIIEAPTGSGKSVWPAATPFFTDNDDPHDSGLPHDSWRVNQREAMQWIAEDQRGSVIALCRTKNLQSVNYGDTYNFDVLFGKSNYKCIHPDSPYGATCADCKHGETMHKCKLFHSCLYVIQKNLCKSSPKASLNYSYYMVARWPRENPPGVLFLDEAHELHQVVTDFAGCTITHKNQVDWGLAAFPELRPTSGGGLLVKVVDPLPQALSWLQDAKAVMGRHWLSLKRGNGNLKKARQCEQLGRKIEATIQALETSPNDWFISSGQQTQTFRKKKRPAFICRPLTSKHHFPAYFLSGDRQVLMSATIGNFESFTQELGIREYQSRVVPNQFPPESRPIYILNCPSMGKSAGESAFRKQADVMAKSILDCPGDWSGLIHVTRIGESDLLAHRLADRGLQDRIWTPSTHYCQACGKMERSYSGNNPKCHRRFMSRTGTDMHVREWDERRQKVENSVCVGWSFGTGYDGLSERICIEAKIPYPRWGSPGSYEAAYRSYSNKRMRWETAIETSQHLGRTRRGREQDYDLDERFASFVAIADDSYKQIKNHFPADTLDALVEL